MIYSVLYAHLNDVYVKAGEKVVYGNVLAKMGNTGEVIPKPTSKNPNAGTHLHLSVVEGAKTNTWTLTSMDSDNKPNQQECLYFIENDIFNNHDRVLVTAGWLNYKSHYAYDIIPQNRKHYDLYWNRSFTGNVVATGYNDGYGKYVIIQYDTSEQVDRVLFPYKTEIEKYQEIIKEQLLEISKYQNIVATQKTELESLNNIINKQRLELGKTLEIINEKTNELENCYMNNNNQNMEVNEKIIKLTEENNLLKSKIGKLEEDLSQVPSEMPKQIFDCPKNGIYTIKLIKGYKLYIKN
ncbi:MAG: peptidoglycan DD-metalloendopeptidase family protein [Bacilli bacterium]|nr:peptidoglycan DD-metalloendopeptidase family protein [Bacilli bacterium]MDD4719009.1 peptidoglycan DD-metalloendopeptidase family protein [Bacilli bacterium]